MAVRAATPFGGLISAFGPVASGDPYGWVRDCTPRAGDRINVFVVGLDAETQRNISVIGACAAASWPNEKPWEGSAVEPKPPFRVFHHVQDGINDRSCVDKLRLQLTRRGWPEAAAFMLDGGPRSAEQRRRHSIPIARHRPCGGLAQRDLLTTGRGATSPR
jgi:hypothetical protein